MTYTHSTGLLAIGVALFSVLLAGCAICCGPDDYAYPTFGGTYQRSDPFHGRVGSIYSDPAVGVWAETEIWGEEIYPEGIEILPPPERTGPQPNRPEPRQTDSVQKVPRGVLVAPGMVEGAEHLPAEQWRPARR